METIYDNRKPSMGCSRKLSLHWITAMYNCAVIIIYLCTHRGAHSASHRQPLQIRVPWINYTSIFSLVLCWEVFKCGSHFYRNIDVSFSSFLPTICIIRLWESWMETIFLLRNSVSLDPTSRYTCMIIVVFSLFKIWFIIRVSGGLWMFGAAWRALFFLYEIRHSKESGAAASRHKLPPSMTLLAWADASCLHMLSSSLSVLRECVCVCAFKCARACSSER